MKINDLLIWLFSAFLGALAWIISTSFLPKLGVGDAKVIAAMVTVSGALLTGIILSFLNKKRELDVQQKIRDREVEESHRDRKVSMYLDFIEMVSHFVQAGNPENKKKELTQQQMLNRFEKFQNGILLWGGPSVIKAYLRYRVDANKGNLALFSSIDNLYRAIREDIGLSNEGLDNLDTVRLHFKNPEEEIK